MSRKLTDEELSEPDVVLIIPLKTWRSLPEGVKKELQAYRDRGNDTKFIYRIPAYLARQLEELALNQAQERHCANCGNLLEPDEGHTSLVYKGAVCDACHEREPG